VLSRGGWNNPGDLARIVQSYRRMDRSVRPPTAPSLGAALGHTIDLAQQVATDELRLLQLESQDRVSDAMHRGMWIGFGALCLAIAWVTAWAAAVVALEDRFSLEARLAMLAITQFAFGAALVRFGLRRRPSAQ
jgi:hypothetical protein